MSFRVASVLLLASLGCDAPVRPQPQPVASAVTAAPGAPATSSAASVPASASAVAEARPIPAESTKIFKERCALCHGKSGKGDGVGAVGMKPPPRNWTDAAWRASVTDDHIATTLLRGGASVGLAATMPASPDIEGRPETVAGLVRIVRSFRRP